MKFRNTFALASVSLLALSVPAFAQNAADEGEAADTDIVVTGTLTRGIAPPKRMVARHHRSPLAPIASTSDLT